MYSNPLGRSDWDNIFGPSILSILWLKHQTGPAFRAVPECQYGQPAPKTSGKTQTWLMVISSGLWWLSSTADLVGVTRDRSSPQHLFTKHCSVYVFTWRSSPRKITQHGSLCSACRHNTKACFTVTALKALFNNVFTLKKSELHVSTLAISISVFDKV